MDKAIQLIPKNLCASVAMWRVLINVVTTAAAIKHKSMNDVYQESKELLLGLKLLALL